MKLPRSLLVSSICMASAAASAVGWENLDEDHHLGGRRCSADYLTGKVVLVCCDLMFSSRMEEIWDSFKTKSFVLLGGSQAPDGVSYPVYSNAKPVTKVPDASLYVVDATGKVRYIGADDQHATELVVTFLTDLESPRTEQQWRQFLDFELGELPGRAYLRYQEFKEKFPAAAKDYADRFAELEKIADLRQLVELVRFSKRVKDLPAINPKQEKLVKTRLSGKIDAALKKFSPLKQSANPLVAREAKNAMADLTWAKAAL